MEEQQTDVNALIEVMNEAYSRELELKTELKKVQKNIEELNCIAEQELKKQNKEIITVGYWSFGWKTTKRNVFNSKLFREENPAIYEKYAEEKEYKKMCFGHLE